MQKWTRMFLAAVLGAGIMSGTGQLSSASQAEVKGKTELKSKVIEELVKALDKLKVGEKDKNELLSVLGPMKGNIVEKP